MEPTATFYKTKRMLLIFVGCLLLAIFAGFKIVNGEQKISILPFQLERPEYLKTILLILVLFMLFQLVLHWAAQTSEVQNNKFHKIDFMASSAVSVAGIGAYAVVAVYEAGVISLPAASGAATALSVVAAFIATIGLLIGTKLLEKYAQAIGRFLKRRVTSEEQNIINILITESWALIFNPESDNGIKRISFSDDGSVVVGKNKNESKWRVRNGLLEILNSEGKIFSRFVYHKESDTFDHTNDDDTLSIRSQRIVPEEEVEHLLRKSAA